MLPPSPLRDSPRAFPFFPAPLALSLALAFPLQARAAEADATGEARPAVREQAPLPKITTTATRTDRDLDAVPATVTAHDREAIDARGARDLKELLDDEVDLSVRAAQPRVSASSSTGRPGNEGLNIRGLEGNQVLLLVDGVRLPSAFSFGPFATGRLDFIDVDALAAAEVLRGPSSSQYGSDGLAGALALRTLRASDLLTGGKTRAGFVKLGAHTVDRSVNATAALAMGGEQLQGLVLVSHRRGHEVDNQGDNDSRFSDRTTPNPLDHHATSLLGSLSFKLNPQHTLDATLEARRREQHLDAISARIENPQPPSQTNPVPPQTVSLVADDTVERQRLTLGHRYANASGWLTEWNTQLHAQHAEVTQFHAEDRFFSADRTRDNRYEERSVALSTQGLALLRGSVPQRLSFGLDLAQSNIHGERDGTVPPFGETFPSKPFPDTRYRTAGAFVQSEIDTESFTVIPALRFDKFSLTPTSTDGFPGTAVSLSDQAFTPRLGAIWRVSPALAPYAQWALGFRAPQPDQVNNGFTNEASGYRSIGNPDLKPEHARSIEIGARGQLETLRWQVAMFDNRYRDFISQTVVGGSFIPVQDPAIFQYVNLANARIRGSEIRLAWQATAAWSGEFALASIRGHSEVDGERTPMDTINPMRTRFALRYDAGDWQASAQWQHSDGKAAKDVSSPSQFLAPESDVVDLFAAWRINPTWSLRGAVLNLFDETYWRWSDVRGVSATDMQGQANPALPAFTAPGRSVQIALRADF